MAYQIIYKMRFYNKLTVLLDYLEKEWSEAVARQFVAKLNKRIETLYQEPLL